MQEKKKRFFTNKKIIIIKIAAACLLFFCCCFFFFQNIDMFWRDLKSELFFFPVLYFLGIAFVCAYISILVGHVESSNTIHSDRYDYTYRIVFTITFITLLVRSFLGDFANPDPEFGTRLNVPYIIIILAIISGIITWLVPHIKDNDSTDF